MEKEKIDVREQILITARAIVEEEGYDNLSIRKITNRMNYSPGIVYHYFKNKDEIMEILLRESFKRVLAALKDKTPIYDDPEKQIEVILRSYIDVCLKYPDEYMSFMLSNKATLPDEGNIFAQGISERRGSLLLMANTIIKGIETGVFKRCNAKLTAKVLWLSIFGLTAKLIIEGEVVTRKQQKRMVDRYVEFAVNGLK